MVQATIDRIDEGVAVLITRNGEPARLTLPARLLPPGSREGDIVSIAITADGAATEAARERVRQKTKRLRDPDRSTDTP